MEGGAKIRVGAFVVLLVVILLLLFRDKVESDTIINRQRKVTINPPSPNQYTIGGGGGLGGFAISFGNVLQKGDGCFSCHKNRSISLHAPGSDIPPTLIDMRPASNDYRATIIRQPPPQKVARMIST